MTILYLEASPDARQWLGAARVTVWSPRLGLHIAIRAAVISADPRYAAFAKEWGGRFFPLPPYA